MSCMLYLIYTLDMMAFEHNMTPVHVAPITNDAPATHMYIDDAYMMIILLQCETPAEVYKRMMNTVSKYMGQNKVALNTSKTAIVILSMNPDTHKMSR